MTNNWKNSSCGEAQYASWWRVTWSYYLQHLLMSWCLTIRAAIWVSHFQTTTPYFSSSLQLDSQSGLSCSTCARLSNGRMKNSNANGVQCSKEQDSTTTDKSKEKLGSPFAIQLSCLQDALPSYSQWYFSQHSLGYNWLLSSHSFRSCSITWSISTRWKTFSLTEWRFLVKSLISCWCITCSYSQTSLAILWCGTLLAISL